MARSGPSERSAIWLLLGANPTLGTLIARYRAGTLAGGCLYPAHVREGHPEQRTASLCHRRWHERARQPHAQLSAAVERRTEPGLAGDPAQSQDRRGIARSAALGPDPLLVQ